MNAWLDSARGLAAGGGLSALGALAVATLVSEDLACIAAGLLVAQGMLSFFPAVVACFTGILAGDLLLVALGRGLGGRALDSASLRRWIPVTAVRRAEGWFAQRGAALILISRFVPGTRFATYFAAGVLRLPVRKFLGWFVLSCALWTPLLVGGAVALGATASRWLNAWTGAAPAVLIAGGATLVLTRLGLALGTWKGRRLLLGRWRRVTRWEFWPAWVVYPPVVIYILWLGLRHRSPTLFTLANPGIGAGGGLAGESKSSILRSLAGAGDAVAAWTLIAPGEPATRAAAVAAFMQRHDAGFPIVLKPDVGERGTGVVIARDPAAIASAFERESAALIAQVFVPGVEFGVFYYRRPAAAAGEILSITEKRAVGVTGDGTRTLEQLILADERAVCMARYFLGEFAARLDEVPAAGSVVALSTLGTHCRGALFLDGTHLQTPALHAAVERISRTAAGFYFGRYDVRTPSVAAFQRGEFTVIELNGLTSEATSIYDPRHNAWFGWRMLCRQWRLAFAIGAENRARGEIPLTVGAIWRLVRAHMLPP